MRGGSFDKTGKTSDMQMFLEETFGPMARLFGLSWQCLGMSEVNRSDAGSSWMYHCDQNL